MFKYVVKRIIYFIPTLFVISLFTFGLSKIAPGDPVQLALGNRDNGGEAGQAQEKLAGERAYYDKAENLGLNLPVFYGALGSSAQPDTLHKIIKRGEREVLDDLISQYGNWDKIQNYYQHIRKVKMGLFDIVVDSTIFENMKEIKQKSGMLNLTSDDFEITNNLNSLLENSKNSPKLDNLHTDLQSLKNDYETIKSKETAYKNYIPSLKWYGIKNQYHRWLFGDAPWFGERQPGQTKGFFRGDFGNSYLDSRPISSKLADAIPWTLLMNVIGLIIYYLAAIPIGVYSAVNKGSKTDRITTIALFIFYSLPSFWIATMLITFVTTSEYGMNWFPTYGVGEVYEGMGALEVFGIRAYHLFLPVFCLIYGGIAYLSRQMRSGMLTSLGQDYIRTARAKGNDEKTVIWKHAFRNSLIPIITIFSHIFPALIAGSFVIEYIFSIPGMGKLTFEAMVARDYPMVFTVVMISSILTLLGNLVADMLYSVVDPRIKY